jgi:uncharacterized repeat protein (TIGR01451 family)
VTWTIPALAASGAGSSATLTISVTITGSKRFTNKASFTQSVPNDVGNVTGSSNTVTVTPQYADLSLTKSAASSTPEVGGTDSFTLTAANAGIASSGQVVVTDKLASGATYVSSNPSVGGVKVSGQTVTWTIPTLAATGSGSSASLVIDITVATAAPFSNQATFTQTVPNETGGTSGSSNTVKVTPGYANLSLTKSVSSDRPGVMSDVTFSLHLSNTGNTNAGKVTVTDVLASGLTFESAHGSSGHSQLSGRTVVWTLSGLAPSASATLEIVVKVESLTPVKNVATFVQTVGNSSGGTTGSSNTVRLTPVYATLHLTKTVADAKPKNGANDRYTITVSNRGPDTAPNVVVSDPLPAGVAYVSSSTPTGTVTFKASDSTVTWQVGKLANGASAVLQLVVKVTAKKGAFTNVASATDSLYDPAGPRVSALATANVTVPVVVPPTPTGEPWSGWWYWLLATLTGCVGLVLVASGGRRRRRRFSAPGAR